MIVSGSSDKTVRIWNADTGECVRVLEGHSDCVWSVSLSEDASMIISGSWDKTVRIWNADTGECVRVLEGHSNYVLSVAISADA